MEKWPSYHISPGTKEIGFTGSEDEHMTEPSLQSAISEIFLVRIKTQNLGVILIP